MGKPRRSTPLDVRTLGLLLWALLVSAGSIAHVVAAVPADASALGMDAQVAVDPSMSPSDPEQGRSEGGRWPPWWLVAPALTVFLLVLVGRPRARLGADAEPTSQGPT
ncbi:MAG: hypothetical protein AAGD06_00495 [Acidobacteriota bacterium]